MYNKGFDSLVALYAGMVELVDTIDLGSIG